MAAGLRHAPHPFQFGAIEVVGTRHLGPLGVDPFLPFLEIVGIVAAVGIDLAVIEFEDDSTHLVEEIAVVGHHEQGAVASGEESLEPFNHLQVEMVGRFIEDEQVGLSDEHIGQCHAFLLSAAEFSHGLVEPFDFELCQNLPGPEQAFLVALMVETGIEHRLLRVEMG